MSLCLRILNIGFFVKLTFCVMFEMFGSKVLGISYANTVYTDRCSIIFSGCTKR